MLQLASLCPRLRLLSHSHAPVSDPCFLCRTGRILQEAKSTPEKGPALAHAVTALALGGETSYDGARPRHSSDAGQGVVQLRMRARSDCRQDCSPGDRKAKNCQ